MKAVRGRSWAALITLAGACSADRASTVAVAGGAGADVPTAPMPPVQPGAPTVPVNMMTQPAAEAPTPVPPAQTPVTTPPVDEVSPIEGPVCDSISRAPEGIPPEVLIVQDLSSSLDGRWQALDDAMTMVARMFDTKMELGLLPYPSTYFREASDPQRVSDDCGVDAGLVVEPALGTGDAIVAMYDRIMEDDLIGGTPTNAALDAARDVLLPRATNDQAAPYVILVTDGDPNCLVSATPGQNPTQGDRDGVTERIMGLAADGVRTFVVGYRFSGGILDTWAGAGQTGTAFEADDTAALLEAMATISAALAPCDYRLNAAAGDPAYVLVQVDGQQVNFQRDDGWVLSADGMTVTLQGAVCDTLRDGGAHTVDVTVVCEPVLIQ